jgi:hypothetical protein
VSDLPLSKHQKKKNKKEEKKVEKYCTLMVPASLSCVGRVVWLL